MPFLSPLCVAELASGARDPWVLTRDLEYRGARDSFTIPAGFDTDFASVPRVFWSVFPPYARYTRAAVLHDYLYAERPLVYVGADEFGEGPMEMISRKDADGIFLRTMKEAGVSWWRRQTMYRAVRAFGGFWWRKRWGRD